MLKAKLKGVLLLLWFLRSKSFASVTISWWRPGRRKWSALKTTRGAEPRRARCGSTMKSSSQRSASSESCRSECRGEKMHSLQQQTLGKLTLSNNPIRSLFSAAVTIKCVFFGVTGFCYFFAFWSRVGQRGSGLTSSAARSEHEVSEIIDGLSEHEVNSLSKGVFILRWSLGAFTPSPAGSWTEIWMLDWIKCSHFSTQHGTAFIKLCKWIRC